ncbi:hypothetical protein LCGC14_2906870 [marine sediment metagenome]|uniref:Glycosyltransferase 2-like domain-containing protein n=1 Tax=marine sediment metagenome TaxID=412755 RepID=A0A0F9AIX8_9ZZZZ
MNRHHAIKDNILIGVTTRGHISVGTVQFLRKQHYDIFFASEGISATIARNIVCRHFLKGTWSHLFFIDDDIRPPEHVIDTLLGYEKQVICANYLLFLDGHLHPAAYKKAKDTYESYCMGEIGMKEVDAIGLGACLIEREVIEKAMAKDCFTFEYDEDGYLSKGEDITFSECVKKLGYPIHYDFNTMCRHVKQIDLCDIEMFLTS